MLVPSSAKTIDFTSLLVVLNMDNQENMVTITGRRTNGSVIGAPIMRTIPVSGRFRSTDILGEMGAGLNEFGPITVESTNGKLLAAISEVSSSQGTAGFFPAINVNKAWTEGIIADVVDTGSKGGLSGTFRTNLGLNTIDSISANVSIALLDDLGNQIGSTLNEVVPGNGMTQKNNIVRLLLGSEDVTGQSGYLRIISDRPIHAWASKIENGTGDPSMEIGIELSRSVGEWAPLQNLPFAPVHSILLPTGKVMIYRRDDSLLWDPVDASLTTLAQFGYDPLCTGHVLIADGRVMFTGGNIAPNVGEAFARYYDPFRSTFTSLPDMAAARWYPSQVTLANGDVATISGDIDNVRNLIPEVWEVNTGTWRILSDASLNLPLYPAAFLAPNGKVFVAAESSSYLDTSGTGGWEAVASRQASGRDNYGSACMYDVGKVIYTGGGDAPIATSEAIELNAAAPAWSFVAPMPEPRRQQNTTILPDRRVLVTGGSSSTGFNTEDGPKSAIVWNPDTNT